MLAATAALTLLLTFTIVNRTVLTMEAQKA